MNQEMQMQMQMQNRGLFLGNGIIIAIINVIWLAATDRLTDTNKVW